MAPSEQPLTESADGRVATEEAWLDGKKAKDHGRSSLLLTGTGLLMEGVERMLSLVKQTEDMCRLYFKY
jgi:hypothetical protein